MPNVNFFGLSLALMTAGACSSMNDVSDALLVQVHPDMVEEIQYHVSQALNGTRVTLAPDILTQSPTLIIEPRGVGVGHPGMSGRIMERPDHFDLKLSGHKCYLVHRETGQVYDLKRARCRPI